MLCGDAEFGTRCAVVADAWLIPDASACVVGGGGVKVGDVGIWGVGLNGLLDRTGLPESTAREDVFCFCLGLKTCGCVDMEFEVWLCDGTGDDV